jgi:hypothetical protein
MPPRSPSNGLLLARSATVPSLDEGLPSLVLLGSEVFIHPIA